MLSMTLSRLMSTSAFRTRMTNDTDRGEATVTLGIPFATTSMGRTIDFHRQAVLRAVEVRNELIDRELPTKSDPEPIALQFVPKPRFGLGLRSAHLPRQRLEGAPLPSARSPSHV
jgi:hypothetical protein